jgi:signal transduction histidine kinase
VRQLVEDAFSSIGRDFKKDKIRVQKDIRQDLMVSVDPVGVRQVLMNLILNAREAMLPDGGKLTITVSATEGGVQIRISDTGCGMSPEQMEHIFEPFYTTKDGQQGRRKGHGVGLSFCKRVLENHGAAIRVQSKPMEGTVFTINLPQAS